MIVGRKRHVVVDTDGRLLMGEPYTRRLSDSASAQTILAPSMRPLLRSQTPGERQDAAGWAERQIFNAIGLALCRPDSPLEMA